MSHVVIVLFFTLCSFDWPGVAAFSWPGALRPVTVELDGGQS